MFIHPPALNRKPAQGFTLLEVIVALALIGIVIGGVYGIADGAIRLSTSMSKARIMEMRVSNFTRTWRDYLENLPPNIRLTAGLEKGARGSAGALLIEGGPAPFAWDRGVKLADAVEFAVVRGTEKKALTLMVRHLKKLEKPTSMEAYRVIAELPLLEDLKEFKAQYYEPNDKRWFSNWDPDKRPQAPLFMRLQFSFQTDPREHEFTFWIANDLMPLAASNPAPTPAPIAP